MRWDRISFLSKRKNQLENFWKGPILMLLLRTQFIWWKLKTLSLPYLVAVTNMAVISLLNVKLNCLFKETNVTFAEVSQPLLLGAFRGQQAHVSWAGKKLLIWLATPPCVDYFHPSWGILFQILWDYLRGHKSGFSGETEPIGYTEMRESGERLGARKVQSLRGRPAN